MKISPYRTCELCRFFERGRGWRDRCWRPGHYKPTRAGAGCLAFVARSGKVEDRIRDLEIERWNPLPRISRRE